MYVHRFQPRIYKIYNNQQLKPFPPFCTTVPTFSDIKFINIEYRASGPERIK